MNYETGLKYYLWLRQVLGYGEREEGRSVHITYARPGPGHEVCPRPRLDSPLPLSAAVELGSIAGRTQDRRQQRAAGSYDRHQTSGEEIGCSAAAPPHHHATPQNPFSTIVPPFLPGAGEIRNRSEEFLNA